MWRLQLALVAVALIAVCQAAILRGQGDFKPGHDGECFIDGVNIYLKINETRPITGCQQALCYDGFEQGTYYYEIHTCGVIGRGPNEKKPVPDRFAVYPDCCE